MDLYTINRESRIVMNAQKFCAMFADVHTMVASLTPYPCLESTSTDVPSFQVFPSFGAEIVHLMQRAASPFVHRSSKSRKLDMQEPNSPYRSKWPEFSRRSHAGVLRSSRPLQPDLHPPSEIWTPRWFSLEWHGVLLDLKSPLKVVPSVPAPRTSQTQDFELKRLGQSSKQEWRSPVGSR